MSELPPACHASEQVPGEAALELDERGGAPEDVLLEPRILLGEAAGEVDRRDVLVDRVGDDVLVEELGRAACRPSRRRPSA